MAGFADGDRGGFRAFAAQDGDQPFGGGLLELAGVVLVGGLFGDQVEHVGLAAPGAGHIGRLPGGVAVHEPAPDVHRHALGGVPGHRVGQRHVLADIFGAQVGGGAALVDRE